MKNVVVLCLLLVTTVQSAHTGENKLSGKISHTIRIPRPMENSPMQKEKKSPAPRATANYKNKIGFELNKGQWPEKVRYKSDLGSGRTLYMEDNKFTYLVYDPSSLYQHHGVAANNDKQNENAIIKLHAFEMSFVNAFQAVEINAEEARPYHHNYFLGNDPTKWASDVPVYNRVSYRHLYTGIDLVAYEDKDQFKYDYIVAAGADPGQIRLKFDGVEALSIKNGNLCISTSIGELFESIPYSYQVINGTEVAVACKYVLSKDQRTVSFVFPQGFDKNYELIIDPVLVAATYSGSNANTYGHCATYDTTGNIYTGGRCFATGYPVTLGAFQTTFGGNVDIAISKLNPTGTTLLYATYLGGSSQDYPHSLYVDLSDQLFVFGSSTSTNYPTSSGCYDNSSNGLSDIVISKLNPTGSTLLGSTYVGGTANDGINVLASYNYGDTYRGEVIVNLAGEPYIVSTTASTNFPVSGGAYDQTANGSQDAVVFKMNSNLTALQWATYLGGTMIDAGCSIRLNTLGEVYVVGVTQGSGFPTSSGALYPAYMGASYDGFVTRLNSSGSALISSTFIGTNFRDIAYFVDLDIYNNVYIYGICEGSLPITPGVYSNPNSQNYVMKLNSSLTTALFTTVLGNGTKGLFSPTALMVDLCGNVYLSGWGNCANYPLTANATQTVVGGNGFHLMVLGQNATSLLYASYFGLSGDHVDGGTSRFDPRGIIYQGVCCCGNGYPTTPGAYAPSKGPASCDIAVFKIDFQINCNPLFTNALICYGNTATINIVNVNGLVNPTYSMQPGNLTSALPVFTVSPASTTTYSVYITGTNAFNVAVTNTGLATVTVAPVPQVSPTFTQATCGSSLIAFDLGLSFIPATPVPTYNVFWSPIPNGILSNTQTAASGSIVPGVYQATITAAHGCSTSTIFTLNPIPTAVSFSVLGPFEVTCYNPTVVVNLVPATYNYTWTGLTAIHNGSSASFTVGNVGNWLVTGLDTSSGCVGTRTFAVTQNISTTTSTVLPVLQNINCTYTSVTTVTASGNPAVNVMHYWLSPYGGTLTANTGTSTLSNLSPGTYTHIMVNVANGCSVTKTFSVTSTSGFPTFSVSSPQNFTLGCYTRSIATIDITNAQTTPQGGGISYALLTPTTVLPYTTGNVSSYTAITIPGTYTVITKDNTNFCETVVLVSVLQNTFSPNISALVPRQILTCDFPTTVLQGITTNTSVTYNWSFPGIPGNLPSDTIRIHVSSNPSSSVIANYTLTITDKNNTCRSSTVVPMLQNLFPPAADFSGVMPISCNTPTITLTNISKTTIPPGFSPSLPVIGFLWMGPSPQIPLQLSSTYLGALPGSYTMVAKDLNNGCTTAVSHTVDDFRDFPIVNSPIAPEPFIFDCAANGATIYPTISSSTVGLAYQWLAVPNTSFSTLTQRSTIVNNVGQFYITVTNTLNGCATSAVVEVNSGDLKAEFTLEPEKGFAPLSVNFTNLSSSSSTLTGKQGITCHWSFGNGTSLAAVSGTFNPLVLYTQPGTHTIVLFANKGTCSDTTARIVRVELPSQLEIPNVFSPNDDGKNDVFFVKAINLTHISALIHDRWGHQVYELISGTGNIAWDGKNQSGVQVAEGVYFYVIKATGSDNITYDQRGTITLVR